MQNLNAEQIKKALECCRHSDSSEEYCADCPYCTVKYCAAKISEDTLSLIKELTEEIERLKSEVSVKRKLLDKAEVRIECVEEENNQLKADICNAEMNLGHITEDNQAKDETITNLIATIKDIQADTVRRMQERLKDCFDNEIEHKSIYTESQVLFVIDQIANELLNGEGMCNEK